MKEDDKQIKRKELYALIFMADPEKVNAKAYPLIDLDINRWAELYGYEVID